MRVLLLAGLPVNWGHYHALLSGVGRGRARGHSTTQPLPVVMTPAGPAGEVIP
jgi:hypothetical protein